MIRSVQISPEAFASLQKRNLTPSFMRAVLKLKHGHNTGVDLKKRKPATLGIWSFRITKKYRAFAKRNGDTLTVYYISDHQE